MFLGNKLTRFHACYVNSWTDELVSCALFHSYCSFDRSEKFGTFIYFNFGVLLLAFCQKKLRGEDDRPLFLKQYDIISIVFYCFLKILGGKSRFLRGGAPP